MSLKLNELKSLHDIGMSLIFLHKRDKRPLGNNWSKLPTKTWAELKSQFDPQYNVGVRLGEHSVVAGKYLACIDVDIKDPAYRKDALRKLKEITLGYELSSFPTVLSGSGNGSRHLYCVTKTPFKMIEIEKHPKKWEICIYSTGRQMVLPPSIHPDSGQVYAWRDPDAELNFPYFKIAKFKAEKESLGTERVLDFKAQDVNLLTTSLTPQMVKMIQDGKGVGDRSAFLLSSAMAMCRAGMDDNQILSVLSNPDHWISTAAFEHAQTSSRARAVKWLHKYTLTKARNETDGLRFFRDIDPSEVMPDMGDEEAEKVSEKIEDETGKKLPDMTKDHKPKNTLRNLVHILENKHFMGGGLVGLNEFSNRVFFLKDTPYGGVAGNELSDHDDLAFKHYLATHYGFEPGKELCFEAHALVARLNRFHPVKEYIEPLVWDKTPRLATWLKRAFKAIGPDEYLSAVGRKVLTAAITRIYEPGCKFDYVLILEGLQGKGKSTALRILAGDKWFTDGLGDIQQKDVVDQMTGKWLIEIGELASIRKSDVDSTKTFLSRQVDRVRMSYGRRSEDYPRQSIFIGTTNNEEYFSDETGNRRFWPVRIDQTDFKWLKKNRDQLWAEAKVRYEACEDLYLEKEIEALAVKEQSKRFTIDEWESEIALLIKRAEADLPDGKTLKITTTQLWRDIMNSDADHPSIYDSKRISKILRRFNFKRRSVRINGDVVQGWVREETPLLSM